MIEGQGHWRRGFRRFRRNRAAMAGIAVLGVIAAVCILGPWASPHAYDAVFWDRIGSGPDLASGFWFGNDANGRDLLTRTLIGGRVSLAVGLVATAVSVVIGVAWGAVAGYAGGRIDAAMMRFVDILYALPFMFFVILLMVFFGRNIVLIFAGIGAVEWLTMARIVRGQTLSLKRREFIEAARAIGVAPAVIVRRHIVPNVTGPVVVYATLTVPQAILVESFISFLGLGVQEPMTSWGVLIADGAQAIETAPWMVLFPALFLAATLLSLNFIGDGLRDAFDPRQA